MTKEHGKPTGEADKLRQDLDRTRQELGETVAELTHRLDVPARAKDAARQQASRTISQTKQTAEAVAEVVTEKARQQVDHLPEPVRRQGEEVVSIVRRRPALAAGVVCGVIALLMVIRARGRRER